MKAISFTLPLILLIFSVHMSIGQGLPKSHPVKTLGSQELTEKLPMGERMGVLSAKPEIPYLEELKKIQSLKKSYDSLKAELKEIKELAQDSTQRDSLVLIAKEQGSTVLKKGRRSWKV